MSEFERQAGKTGRLVLPSGQIIPLTDWSFATTQPSPHRLETRGRFTVAEAITLTPDHAEVILEEEDPAGRIWRGAVALEGAARGLGEVAFRALHELMPGGAGAGGRASRPRSRRAAKRDQ